MSRTTLALDSHTVSNFMTCEQLYSFSTLKGFQPSGLNFGLSRGTRMHNALYLFYKAKIARKPFKDCVAHGMRYLKWVGRSAAPADFLQLVTKYSSYCGLYRNENIQPLAVEKGFSKILYQDKDYLFVYEGRIDFVGRFHNDPQRYWVDHKTEARKEELNPNSFQFLGYSWAMGTTCGLINYIGFQESLGLDSFRRTIVNHRRDLIEEWHKQMIDIYFRIARFHNQGHPVKNRKMCKPYMCRPCAFNEVCAQTHPGKIQALLAKDFTVRSRPWKAWD